MQNQESSIIRIIQQRGLYQQRVFENFWEDNIVQGKQPLPKENLNYFEQQKINQLAEKDEKAMFNDSRNKIQHTTKYPICCIGLLTFKFKLLNGYVKSAFGTGFLIKGNIILTAAHNVYNRDLKDQNFQIYFQVARNGFKDDNRKEQAIIKYIDQRYKSCSKETCRQWDWAILTINKDLSNQCGYFGIRADWRNKNDKISIIGYPNDLNQKHIQQHQYYMFGQQQLQKVLSIQERIINYQISTGQGNSGSPVFIRDQYGRYFAVGVHVGSKQWYNQGVRINEQMVKILNREFKKSVSIMNLSKISLSKEDLKIVCEKRWGNLNCLDISHNQLKGKDIQSLKSKYFHSLKSLAANDNQFNQESCQIIKKSFQKLEELDLGNNNKIGDEGIKKLLQKRRFQNLKFLNLENCSIFRQINHICSIQSLKILVLINNCLQEYVVQNLLKTKWENLEKLYIGPNGVNKKISECTIQQNHIFVNILDSLFKYKTIDAYECTWKSINWDLMNIPNISQNEIQSEKPNICCKLTKKIMSDPVYLNCSHRFQRTQILKRYEQEKQQKCPVEECNIVTLQKNIRTHELINKEIQFFKKKLMKKGQKYLKEKIRESCFSTLKFQIEFNYKEEQQNKYYQE